MRLFWDGCTFRRIFYAIMILLVLHGATAGAPRCIAADVKIAHLRGSGDSLKLIDAVYIAMAQNPDIQLKREAARELEGSVMITSGQFDSSLFLNMAGGFLYKELTPLEWRTEYIKREVLRIIAEDADNLANGGDPDDNTIIISDGVSLEEFDVEDEDQETELMNMYESLSDRCGEIESLEEFYLCLSYVAQTNLDAIGSIPKETEDISASLATGLRKTFRNGIVLTPEVSLDMKHRQFRGKPRSKKKGGTGQIEAWTATVAFNLKVPLGKGWGADSTGAAEKAAQFNYGAGISQIRHTVANTILNVTETYWDLVAAQERQRLWEDSAQLQTRIMELSHALVEAEEIPRADLERIKAKAASVDASLISARRTAKEIRLQLGELIGFDIEELHDAPRISDIFPKPPDLSTLSSIAAVQYVEKAIERRQDYQAALKLKEAARVLEKAARLDLRHRKDLDLSVSYKGIDKDSSVLNGIGSAFYGGYTGPSILLTFTIDWPFNNNRAKGELVQARARWRRSNIIAYNLERTISSNVLNARRTLLGKAEQVHFGIESVKYYEDTVVTAFENFKLGNLDLVDALLTEERLTDASLALINAKQAYAKALARLRFETGMLIFHEDENYRINRQSLFTIPFLRNDTNETL